MKMNDMEDKKKALQTNKATGKRIPSRFNYMN